MVSEKERRKKISRLYSYKLQKGNVAINFENRKTEQEILNVTLCWRELRTEP